VGSRNTMHRVSGRFYMGAGARAQGEGSVQKKQIGTGARLANFYRAKHPGLHDRYAKEKGTVVQDLDSIEHD
jgi:hypothetical protein